MFSSAASFVNSFSGLSIPRPSFLNGNSASTVHNQRIFSSQAMNNTGQLARNRKNHVSRDDEEEILDFMQTADALLLAAMSFIQRTPQIRRESNGRRSINRNRFEGYTCLYNDYFAEQPIYPDRLFRRRFRMRRPLFLRLTKSITEHDSYTIKESLPDPK